TAPHRFLSGPAPLPRGTYDVSLHLILESGAQLTVKQPRCLVVQESEEPILLEIKQAGGDEPDPHASRSRSHLDFGTVGDRDTRVAVEISVRTRDVPYAL